MDLVGWVGKIFGGGVDSNPTTRSPMQLRVSTERNNSVGDICVSVSRTEAVVNANKSDGNKQYCFSITLSGDGAQREGAAEALYAKLYGAMNTALRNTNLFTSGGALFKTIANHADDTTLNAIRKRLQDAFPENKPPLQHTRYDNTTMPMPPAARASVYTAQFLFEDERISRLIGELALKVVGEQRQAFADQYIAEARRSQTGRVL